MPERFDLQRRIDNFVQSTSIAPRVDPARGRRRGAQGSQHVARASTQVNDATPSRWSSLRLRRENIGADLAAGATFAVVNVPHVMAKAVLATFNPVAGL